MIYLLKYGSTNCFGNLNLEDNSINFKGLNRDKLNSEFLRANDRGWYTTVNCKHAMFYRVSNEIYFSYGSFKVRIDDNIQIKLSRHPKLAFLNKLVIADGENEILRLVYLPKRNPFKSFDTTMGQEDHELDLITLVFYVMTNEKIKMRFKQTGYY